MRLELTSPKTRLGGSDGNKQDGSAHNIESILDKKLNEFSNKEKLGPKVSDNLAKMVNTLLTSPMETTKKNDLLDNYRRPENCSLNSPRVNDVFWDLCIDSFGRSLDVKLQSIQKLLLKELTPIVAAANRLLTADHKDDNQQFVEALLNSVLDGIALISSSSYSLSTHRRTNLKQFLNEKYSSLCSSKTPVTYM